MATTKCPFWDCNQDIVRASIFCLSHDLENRRGWIDECPTCKRYKYTKYETCLECSPSNTSDGARRSQTSGTKRPDGSYMREHSSRWDAGDEETDHWYVYILQLSDKSYYVGQTNNLRIRLREHNDGNTKAIGGKDFELVWFTTVYSRRFAEELEADLKEVRDKNERGIRTMVLDFEDSVRDMGYSKG
jgi:predicted GIY-YIG superfamily endonuclease